MLIELPDYVHAAHALSIQPAAYHSDLSPGLLAFLIASVSIKD